jgi:hypothetical protein
MMGGDLDEVASRLVPERCPRVSDCVEEASVLVAQPGEERLNRG